MKTYTETDDFIYDSENQTWILKNESNIYYAHVLQEMQKDKAVAIPYVPATTWDHIRATRNLLLKECDWVALPDATSPHKQAWMEYRQALRDITKSTEDPKKVKWPNKPE